MISFGLEKEMFLMVIGESIPMVIPRGDLPSDECGLLVEARGTPYPSITEAVFSLKSEEFRLTALADKQGWRLDDSPILPISRKLKVEASRSYDKGVCSYRNLYGYECHRNKLSEQTAGVHISFKNMVTFSYRKKDGGKYFEFKYCRNFDYVRYIIALDIAFKDEIKKAKRNPGFYELKNDGRIEYRSLPSNVDLYKVIDVVEKVE